MSTDKAQLTPKEKAHNIADHLEHHARGASSELHAQVNELKGKSFQERQQFYSALAQEAHNHHLPGLVLHEDGKHGLTVKEKHGKHETTLFDQKSEGQHARPGHKGKDTEHKGKDTEHKGKDTEHKGKDTEHKGKDTEHKGKDTEHKGKDTEHKGKDTEHKGKDTEHKGKDTEHKGEDTEHKGEDTEPKGKDTEHKDKAEGPGEKSAEGGNKTDSKEAREGAVGQHLGLTNQETSRAQAHW